MKWTFIIAVTIPKYIIEANLLLLMKLPQLKPVFLSTFPQRFLHRSDHPEACRRLKTWWSNLSFLRGVMPSPASPHTGQQSVYWNYEEKNMSLWCLSIWLLANTGGTTVPLGGVTTPTGTTTASTHRDDKWSQRHRCHCSCQNTFNEPWRISPDGIERRTLSVVTTILSKISPAFRRGSVVTVACNKVYLHFFFIWKVRTLRRGKIARHVWGFACIHFQRRWRKIATDRSFIDWVVECWDGNCSICLVSFTVTTV